MADVIEAAPAPRAQFSHSDKEAALKSSAADEGYEYFDAANTQALVISDEESARVARKIDLHLLPLMCLLYGLCYVDKSALGWAVLFNFRKDLKLVGDQYNWGSSIFYFGFLAAQYPANYLLQKYKTGVILGYSIIVWGILMLGHIGLHNFAGLMVIRFLLGAAEASVMPAFVLYTSVWYTRREQILRTLLWCAMQGLFTIIGSLMSYGLGHITNTAIKPWAYIFLVLGLLSLINGVLWLLLMPETPNKAKFLTEEEKKIAVQRVALNMTGIKGYEWKNYQIVHALQDPKVWLLMACKFFGAIPNGGLTSFGSLVIKGFGFTTFNTLLIGLPSSVVSAGSMFVWSLICMKYDGMRTWGMSIPLVISIAGVAGVYATQGTDANPYGRVVAYWLINSYAVTSPFSLAIIGANISGHTKRAVTNTLGMVMYAVGNIAGPFFFRSQDAPKYVLAITSILVFLIINVTCALALRYYMIFENKRRDRRYGKVEGEILVEGARMGMHDKTDNENTDFRYVL